MVNQCAPASLRLPDRARYGMNPLLQADSPVLCCSHARNHGRQSNLSVHAVMVNQESSGAPLVPNQDEASSTAQEEAVKPPVTIVLLIRHGENEWVSTGKLAGRTPGVHLNDKGRQQAQQLADYLKIQPIEALYSSPLERCVETAMPLAEVLHLPVQMEPGVLEVDYGDWHGIELKQASQRPEWMLVQHYPSIFRFPEGEGLRQTQHRAVDGVERIVANHPDAVVAIFSHGDVIRTLMAHYAGVPLDLFQRLQISTGSVSTIRFVEGRPAIVNMNLLPQPEVIRVKRDPPQPTDVEAIEQSAADAGQPDQQPGKQAEDRTQEQ